jgi:hypothetical protein
VGVDRDLEDLLEESVAPHVVFVGMGFTMASKVSLQEGQVLAQVGDPGVVERPPTR